MKINKVNAKFIVILVVFILISLGIVLLFISKTSIEGKEDYFEGKVLENTNDSIIVQIDSSYENLINKLGDTVKIEKADIVRKCDFSKFSNNETVRVLYSGIDSERKTIETVFAVYMLSEIQ